MMYSADNNPAIQETNRLKLSVGIVEDHIPMKEVVSPAPLSSKAATIVEQLDTMQSCVESHKQAAIVKIGVKAVVEVAIVDMADLGVYITGYTVLM